MKRIAKRNRYLTAGVATLCSSILLSGCVSSTINTPEGFAASSQIPQTADILALNNEDVLTTADAMEESDGVSGLEDSADLEEDESDLETGSEATLTALAQTDGPTVDGAEAVTGSIAGESAILADAPEAAMAEATDDINDVATQRIAAADSAPVGTSISGVEPTAAGETGATSIAAVASPSPPVEIATASLAPIAQTTSSAPEKNRPGFLSALFGKAPKRPAVPVGGAQKIVARSVSFAPPAPVAPQRVIATASASGSVSALPGVNRDRALGVNTGSSPSFNEPIQVASAAGLARLAPNGLATQNSGVDIKCLKPALVRVLKQVERKYGKPAVVTSGYRSPSRNAKASGAKNSLHMYCAAADIQVEGVDKWALAKYLRSMPGRGGVGTYCHTKSVHIDIGPNRDWNWRCRRKK